MATIGPITQTTEGTTWEAQVTGLAPGTSTFTVSDGTDSVQVTVEGAPEYALPASLGLASSAADAYYLARDLALGRSYLAGPYELLDAPSDRTDLRPRLGVTSASAFAAAWSDAEALAAQYGFASLPAFVAAWTKAETLAQSFGFSGVDAYVIAIRENAAPWGQAFGFESGAGFAAAWSRTTILAQRLGFAGASAFVASWNETAEFRPMLGLSSDAAWQQAFPMALALAARHGISAASSFLAAWEENVSLAATLGVSVEAQFWDDMAGGLTLRYGLGLRSDALVKAPDTQPLVPGHLVALRPTLELCAHRPTLHLVAMRAQQLIARRS